MILDPRGPANTAIFTFDTPLTWVGANGHIAMAHDIVLSTTWTIAGQVTINGNGNALTMVGGALVVAPNSQLTIENCRINQILPNQILCADNSATIILDNVAWIQADNYEFIQGALNFKGTVLMSGQGLSFSYMSTQTSTILANANLELDNLFTFNYNPSNASTTLLAFQDATSMLSINHSTLDITPGLQLTGGQLNFSKAPTINALGAATDTWR